MLYPCLIIMCPCSLWFFLYISFIVTKCRHLSFITMHTSITYPIEIPQESHN
ncbi:hypothetical protein BD408DRAFT_408374 [Parasitella parasitica]|nr:hypothetical protein BD408DRAFT_408374 [Parasitella parasitica]